MATKTKTKSPPGTRSRPTYDRPKTPRAKPTETQRNLRSAATLNRKVEGERRTTSAQKEATHNQYLVQRGQSRRNYRQTQAVAEAMPARTGPAFESPHVSLAGGFAKMALITISLIVLYALVTHSSNTATGIGRIGGVLAYLTTATPLFQTGSGGTSSGSSDGATGTAVAPQTLTGGTYSPGKLGGPLP